MGKRRFLFWFRFAMGAAGTDTLWTAAFADMGASLMVVANGLRLLRQR
jgi:Zn2+/Cd2+-exporting ATPase